MDKTPGTHLSSTPHRIHAPPNTTPPSSPAKVHTPQKSLYESTPTSQPVYERKLSIVKQLNFPQITTSRTLQKSFSTFLFNLKEFAQHHQISISNILSGERGTSILTHLYQHNSEIALQLLEERINIYQKKYENHHAASWLPQQWLSFTWFDAEEPEATEEEKDFFEMHTVLNQLKNAEEVNLSKFQTLLHQLRIFEIDAGNTPYEDRCNLALLANAEISHTEIPGIAPEWLTNIEKLLDHTETYLLSTSYLFCNGLQVHEAIQKFCTNTSKKRQQKQLQKLTHQLDRAGHLDLTHHTLLENIERLCFHDTHKARLLIDLYYQEAMRRKLVACNPLLTCSEDSNIADLLKGLLKKDKALKIWIQKTLGTLYIQHQEAQFIAEQKEYSPEDLKIKWYPRLSGLIRLSQENKIKINSEIFKPFKLWHAEKVAHYIQHAANTYPSLWLLDNNDTAHDIQEKLFKTSSNSDTHPCLRALWNYLMRSTHFVSQNEQRTSLQLKETLLKTQQDYFFEQAQHCINQTADPHDVNTLKTRFEQCMHAVITIEKLRPPITLLDTHSQATYNLAKTVGSYIIRSGEMPISQRMRNLTLEFQLKHQFHYDFQKEISAQMSTLSNQFWSTFATMKQSVQEGASLIYKTATGHISLMAMCRKSIALQQGSTNEFIKVIDQQLKDYATLCTHHPRMARILAGNIAQTLSIISGTMNGNSQLYNIFQQFNQRIGGEALATYMIEEFNVKSVDLSEFNEEEMTAMKRVYAICQLFQWAPETITGATGAINVAQHLVQGNPLTAMWSATKTMFHTSIAHLIKRKVSTLSDEEVQGINLAIMSFQHGPMQAGLQLQNTRAAMGFLADHIKGHSFTYSASRAFLRPLTVRFTRLQRAYADYQSGKSPNIISIISETLKLTAIATPIVLSVATVPILGTVAGPIFISYSMTAGPLSAIALIKLFYQLDPMEDTTKIIGAKLAEVIVDRAHIHRIRERIQRETNLLIERGSYQKITCVLTHEQLYLQHWETFQEHYPEFAMELPKKSSTCRCFSARKTRSPDSTIMCSAQRTPTT